MNKLIERILKVPLSIRLAATGGAVVLITAACWFLVISALVSETEQNEVKHRSLTQELIKKRTMADELARFMRDTEILQARFDEARSELPADADIDELLGQLNDIGKKSGLEIVNLEPGQEVSQQFYAAIPIKMQVSGSYHEIAVFFESISKLRRIVNVSGILLDSPQRKNEKVFLKATYLATTFRFVETSENVIKTKANAKGKK